MKSTVLTTLGVASAVGLLVFAGCTGSATTSVSPEAAAMLISERPDGALTVTEVRDKIEQDGSLDEVAVEARVGGVEMPFLDGGFFVTATAPAAAADDHDHAGHDHGDHDHADHDHADHDHAAGEEHAHDDHDHAHGDKASAADDHGHEHAHGDDEAGHVHGQDDHGHDHGSAGHDHENCPFCKQGVAGKRSLACVKLIGKDGNVLAKPADRALGLKGSEKVVVIGKPSIDELGNLYIEATQVWIDR